MTESEKPVDRATEIIQGYGCPICGKQPASYSYNAGARIGLSQCGHNVSLEDARRLQELQEEIDAQKWQEDEVTSNLTNVEYREEVAAPAPPITNRVAI